MADSNDTARATGARFAPFHSSADDWDWDERLGALADHRIITVDRQADPAGLACLVSGRAMHLQKLIDFAGCSRTDGADSSAEFAGILAPLVSEDRAAQRRAARPAICGPRRGGPSLPGECSNGRRRLTGQAGHGRRMPLCEVLMPTTPGAAFASGLAVGCGMAASGFWWRTRR
jgi:hypothetical protein